MPHALPIAGVGKHRLNMAAMPRALAPPHAEAVMPPARRKSRLLHS
ncbi:hypothetical protein [Mailhella massiliensis]|nr:hypothetical protein [Mailhella massiliensis]